MNKTRKKIVSLFIMFSCSFNIRHVIFTNIFVKNKKMIFISIERRA